MKKRKAEKKILVVLICIHEILLIVIGMGLALMMEAGRITNGAALVIPMAFLLIIFGWILRDSFGDIRE